ncbi:MAG: hypothetical protein Q9222_004517 [Ikaeria aurantiellina]
MEPKVLRPRGKGPYPTALEYYALFCTSQVPAQIIDDFLKTANEDSFDTNNIFTLVRSRDQTELPRPTPYPIEGGDFTTGFAGASIPELGAFCRSKFPEETCPPPKISPDAFVIMDERTVRDGTVVLVKWDFHAYWIDPNNPSDEDDNLVHTEDWLSFRTPAPQAADTMSAVEYIEFDQAVAGLRPEDNGVLDFEKGKSKSKDK